MTEKGGVGVKLRSESKGILDCMYSEPLRGLS